MPFDYDFRLRIAAPRPVVFERLLRIEHLSRWFCGWSRIEPKVGGSFKFGGETCILPPEGRSWETTIDEGEVLRKFGFTWPIQGAPTRVAYLLDDEGTDRSILSVQHRGVPVRETTCGTVQDAWRMCLGNLKSTAEGRGDSVRPDHSPVAAPDVALSALIEAKVPKVFGAFAHPDPLGAWSGGGTPVVARVDPRPGGAFSFGWPGGPDRVVAWEPDRRIALRGPEGTTGALSFDFEEKASGTAVYLRASGFPSDAPAEPLRARGRWSDLLVCLKNFVEGGSPGFVNAYAEQVTERGD